MNKLIRRSVIILLTAICISGCSDEYVIPSYTEILNEYKDDLENAGFHIYEGNNPPIVAGNCRDSRYTGFTFYYAIDNYYVTRVYYKTDGWKDSLYSQLDSINKVSNYEFWTNGRYYISDPIYSVEVRGYSNKFTAMISLREVPEMGSRNYKYLYQHYGFDDKEIDEDSNDYEVNQDVMWLISGETTNKGNFVLLQTAQLFYTDAIYPAGTIIVKNFNNKAEGE
ncbi:MAG: hypothetical protein LBO69_02155 [Ignavibacteria bacterium]|jgi:hypothetical protein|nr:hypothetical protein [Ignavibacteria bacterium]